MAGDGAFELSICGNASARYQATCYVETRDATQTVELCGKPPLETTFEGDAIACEVEQTSVGGQITVALTSSNGNFSRMTTYGPGSLITVSVD